VSRERALDELGLARVEARVAAGVPLTKIAAELGVAYKTVQKAVKELGLQVATRVSRKPYPVEMREVACDRYAAGESSGQIARTLGVSDSWVQSVLHATGVQPRSLDVLAHISEDIAARYVAGESTGQIARALGVTDTTISNHLRRQGQAVRRPGWANRKYGLRDDAFHSPMSDEAAYWIGFLLADGCVSAGGRVTLALAGRDLPHIRSWLRFLGSPERPIAEPKGKARAQVSSRELTVDLAKHGVVVGKTRANTPTSDEMAARPSFWRGMVDGDGTITIPKGKHGPVLLLGGSPAIMRQYADFLAQQVLDGFAPRVLEVHNTKVIMQVKIEGVRARKAIEALWGDVDLCVDANACDRSAPALERKVERAKIAVAWRTRTEMGPI
jgi:DNA-binding CsgD family transcriptional regulator